MKSSNLNRTLSARRRARISTNRALDNLPEPLETRRLYAVTAMAAGGVLTVAGDNNANSITVSRNATGTLLVNGGTVPVLGSPATVAGIASIRVSGLGGDDRLLLDETNGALPRAFLSGGAGNDTLTGGSGADALVGDDGNDLLLGKAGNDQLFGGAGDDTLTGGPGADRAQGQAGNDRMIWNPGDGSDLNEGGDGTDTVEVNGGDAAEVFSAQAVGGRVLFRRVDPAPFTIDVGTSEKLALNAKGGDDSFFGGTGLATLTAFTVDGGAGNDSLFGTDGADTLIGGDGKDLIDGNAGNDTAFLGAGDDVFRWDPGDGSDVVDGQAGNDQLLFNGANLNEKVDLSAVAGHLRFGRDVGGVIMDVNDTEVVQFNALGGADSVTVHDLRGSDVRAVELDLTTSTGSGDRQTDDVVLEGGSGRDVVTVSGIANTVSVGGLAASVFILGGEQADRLSVNTLGGRDVVNAAGLNAPIRFAADGGTGNDVLIGGASTNTLRGGEGDDVLIGGLGPNLLDGGPGDNIIVP
jgi:Ca2+-binding RTX toxin-like protein